MNEFFEVLTTLDKIFLVCACVGGLLFLIRLVMQFLGADADMDADFDADFDVGADAGGDSDSSFRAITYQGLVVFFMMFGLEGLCLHIAFEFSPAVSIAGAVGAGLVSVWIIERIMSSIAKLQSSGTLDMKNAVGQEGSVYLGIPPEGTGKVRVTFQNRLRVLDAISQDKEEIKTGQRVLVVDVVNNMLVVEKS